MGLSILKNKIVIKIGIKTLELIGGVVLIAVFISNTTLEYFKKYLSTILILVYNKRLLVNV
jgi:hypothetical protein